MIYSLRGQVLYAEPGMVVIECNGVGYKCLVSLTTLSQLPPKNTETTLYTYMSVREDSVDLYGFADQDELACFKLLTSVNGVSSRIALSILSDLTTDKLTLTIASGDEKTLTISSGVGKKLASRIILELGDKMGGLSFSPEHYERISSASPAIQSNISEAAAALVTLGYSQSEAAVALSACPVDMSVEHMIKAGLKQLSQRK